MSARLLYPRIWKVFQIWEDHCGITMPCRDTYRLPEGPNWGRICKFLEEMDDSELEDWLSREMHVEGEVAQYARDVLDALAAKHGAYY
jgi:hypothetical protein